MLTAALILFMVLIVSFAIWVEDDSVIAFIVTAICAIALLCIFAFMPAPPKIKQDSITIQEIEYAINKCSSFGGLKEFRSDVIICMDKTEINMNFEPEKKVEAE